MRNAVLVSALLCAAIPMAVAAPQSSAAPSILSDKDKDPVVKLAFGQQMQDEDQTNHWVVWVEGKEACPPTQVLGSLINSPCGVRFNVPGVQNLEFSGCDAEGEPHMLLVDGNFARSCKHSKHSVHCVDSVHSILKHGKCVDS
ncbi:hypothetical protein ONZ43_g1400 [Nemania bipapillata]|uniref:Uncharacterized protein n=1 Tax=Nemania bipapillata TaxID=110536 RepID=A0ACC2J4Y7_9PEZI|nr:hypothetical protein ONZ43_g1400 [Nemania bipapillata]